MSERHPWQDAQGRGWALNTGDICAVCGHTPDTHEADLWFAEKAALKAGTHEPAVDDFGNEYLARTTPSVEPAGIEEAALASLVQRLITEYDEDRTRPPSFVTVDLLREAVREG